MNGAEALKRFEEEYLEKVLGFCYQKVNNRENAEDLSVEISLEVLKAIRSGKEIENLGAFVWSVSNHTFSNGCGPGNTAPQRTWMKYSRLWRT